VFKDDVADYERQKPLYDATEILLEELSLARPLAASSSALSGEQSYGPATAPPPTSLEQRLPPPGTRQARRRWLIARLEQFRRDCNKSGQIYNLYSITTNHQEGMSRLFLALGIACTFSGLKEVDGSANYAP
jgi:hypothetical protein